MKLLTWQRAALAGVVLALVHQVAVPPLRDLVWLGLLALACVGLAVGILRHRPSVTRPWLLLLTGFVVLFVANAVDASGSLTLTDAADTVRLVAYPLILVAALGFVRAQAPGGDREGAIDGAIVMIALATVLSGTVFAPAALESMGHVPERAVLVAAPLLCAATTATTLRLLFVTDGRYVSTWLVVLASAAGLTGNVARTLLTSGGSYEPGGLADLALAVVHVAVAVAALHPSMRHLTEPSEEGDRRLSYARLLVLAVALLAAPATLLLGEQGVAWWIPVVASAAVSLLVLVRLGGLVMEREAVRRELHTRVARQEALARLGLRALDDRRLEMLFEEAGTTTAELLQLYRCEVVAGSPASAPGMGVVSLRLGGSGHGYGALVAARFQRWNDEDLAFLQAVANVLSGAIEREEAQRVMQHRAVHDPLTKLPNRTYLWEHLAGVLDSADGARVAALFVDIDGFKPVNDHHGHAVGDRLLVGVAKRLKRVVRPQDLLVRLAGDEFVAVCRDVDEQAARAVAERMVAVVTEPFVIDGTEIRIGASVGVALTDGDTTPDHLVSRADRAMYVAKGRPGPSVAVFDPTDADPACDPSRWASPTPAG